MQRLGALSALILAASLVACSGSDNTGSDDKSEVNAAAAKSDNGVTLGADGRPVDADGKPVAQKLDGLYELTTELDLTEAGVFPDVVNDTLGSLSKFKDHPTQTIIDLANNANVPLVGFINDLPDVLTNPVLGWIDDHVFGALYNAAPVTKTFVDMITDLANIATRFDVVTTLDLPAGDATGDAKATHVVSGMTYHWNGKPHPVKAPEITGKLAVKTVDANAVLLDKAGPDLETGRLRLGDHTLQIPVGGFAVYGMDALAKDKFGAADFRAAVGKVLDCNALADAVSKKCIDIDGPLPGGNICVGHKSDIANFCSKGLDLIVNAIKSKLSGIDIPALDFQLGSAEMWDAPAKDGPIDGTVDRIDSGFWQSSVKSGKDTTQILATFTGKRVGETTQK